MSMPMTADELVAAFDKWGVKYKELPGWRTHNRAGHGAWGPVYGIGLHHTGDDLSDELDQKVLWEGRAGLPGPLCTWGQRDDGVAVLIGCGRSNHFGGGDPRVLQEVIHESYDRYPSPSRYHEGSPGATDGNTHFYGQETMYSGGHPMSIEAYRNTLLAFAAVCDFHGWTAKSAIGHKEWSNWKPDPGNLDMAKFRKDLQATLDNGPGHQPKPHKGVRKDVTQMRRHVKTWTAKGRRSAVRHAAITFDRQLARIERL